MIYRADDHLHNPIVLRWSPSIFMPRWASRISLRVVKVSVERLQAVSEADCIAEGIASLRQGEFGYALKDGLDWHASYRDLWESLNAERGLGWTTNPWVWVVEFQRRSHS